MNSEEYNEEIEKVLAENEAKRGIPKDVNMFDYVTIPVKEYRQLIEELERAKAKAEMERQDAIHARAEKYDAQEMLKQYKNDLRKKCGLDELKKVGEQDAES